MHKLDYRQLTSIGDKETNQDYMLVDITDDCAVFIVADGLGGHKAGEMASHYFCHSFVHLAAKYGPLVNRSPNKVVRKWLFKSIKMMEKAFQGDPVAKDAYTTCAILILTKKHVISAHCGDSRIYRINKGGIVWRTKDHSIPQQLFDGGELEEHEMGTHPEQNQLTRCINIANKFSPEIHVFSEPKLGETYVLCSDGFWEFTKEHEFISLATEAMDKDCLLKRAKMALFRASGKADNLTVQWVRVGV
ncbi:MAG: PPM family protein phosphatase [Methyloprofundus sp.]|nr:MAG: PPM family protein phosphatase [Methyloprofundus sp.]